MEGPALARTARDLVFGLSLRFEVVVDDFDLGSWSICDGLSVSFEVISQPAGKHDEFTLVQGRTTYNDITLTRPVTPASRLVSAWLSAVRRHPMKGTGKITLKDAQDIEVMRWQLSGVLPLKWQGPKLDVSTNSVATETLVLKHEGFLY